MEVKLKVREFTIISSRHLTGGPEENYENLSR